tara:strand:- start:1 stop:357 length:357 start_codon:yes stop_codon:yes gene_type:complete
MRILIVGDDAQDGQDLSDRLRADDFEVASTNDVREALLCANRKHPDVIIANIDMPALDSHQFAQFIRKTRWGRLTALIGHTGCGSAENKKNAMAAGFDLYLCRPLKFDIIRSLIEGCR